MNELRQIVERLDKLMPGEDGWRSRIEALIDDAFFRGKDDVGAASVITRWREWLAVVEHHDSPISTHLIYPEGEDLPTLSLVDDPLLSRNPVTIQACRQMAEALERFVQDYRRQWVKRLPPR
jgi:hypothetical protein